MASVTSPARPDDTGPDTGYDWSFSRRPFWLFSHLFALAVVALFVNLGLWQLSRHDDRQAANAAITERLTADPLEVATADDLAGDPAELDYRPVSVSGTFLEGDFVRVANRSQGGVAGEYVVGIVELADDSLIAVNRGFVPLNAEVTVQPVSTGTVSVDGWLRESSPKGRFGADDTGEGNLVPRMNTEDLAARLGQAVAPVWLQEADNSGLSAAGRFPDPVPLPEFGAGPHLGYAAQWFIFAALGLVVYGALLRRRSRAR